MHKYKEYLDTYNEHMKQMHIQQSPIISPDESFSVTPIVASLEPTKSCYSNVHEALVNLEPYAPQDRSISTMPLCRLPQSPVSSCLI